LGKVDRDTRTARGVSTGGERRSWTAVSVAELESRVNPATPVACESAGLCGWEPMPVFGYKYKYK
jgi:hypothetical protein